MSATMTAERYYAKGLTNRPWITARNVRASKNLTSGWERVEFPVTVTKRVK